MSANKAKLYYQNTEVATTYDRDRFASCVGRTFDRLEKKSILKVLAPIIREIKDNPVLDIPCGTGRITELLLGQGLQVTGGDISEEMIECARDKCSRFGDQAEFRRLDLDGIDCADNSYMLVSCIRLFHHLGTADRERILKELARVSRKYVLINVSYLSPYYRFRRFCKRKLGLGISSNGSTWDEINREASSAGLSIINVRFVARFVSEDMIIMCEKLH